jgi:hypothetical protein
MVKYIRNVTQPVKVVQQHLEQTQTINVPNVSINIIQNQIIKQAALLEQFQSITLTVLSIKPVIQLAKHVQQTHREMQIITIVPNALQTSTLK